jgi:hypothetical protein
VADITPELGIQLAGDIGRHRPCEEIRERLHVRALVLEEDGKRCCLLALDLLAASNAWAHRVRREVADVLGIAPEAVIFHILQNHAAPNLGHTFVTDECTLFPPEYPWLRGGDDRYNPVALAGCVTAAKEAQENLQPVTLSAGRMPDGRVAFNRRFVLRDGTALTHPGRCNPNVLHAEGPVDPEVGVLALTGADDMPVATLLHHTCHPTHGYPHRYVIADWPGAWPEMVEERLGGTALTVNGCCGNIHHYNHIDPDYRPTDTSHREMAAKLTQTAVEVAQHLQPLDSAPLAWERTVLRLPLRLLTPEVIADAQRIIDAYPEPKFLDEEHTCVDWDWVYAAATLDLKATQDNNPYCDYEIQAFRLGDFALVTLMGEPFVEIQLRIKLESPAPYTFVAHFCNGYAGYIPTADALQRGGYETRTSNWSKFQPDALEQIGDAAVGLLQKLWSADLRVRA